MKKLLLPFFALLFLISCGKESTTDLVPETDNYADGTAADRSSNKRDVCHNGDIINININAIPAHQAHGDAVDMDGDGFFDIENPCSETDCDDTVYDLENSCCETCCDDGYAIEFEGTLIVACTDEPGSYNWQEAKDACLAKGQLDGLGWYLPSKDELNAVHGARNEIGGFTSGVYLSSDEYTDESETYDDTYSWCQHFFTIYEGNQVPVLKTVSGPCRCVRK
jgi:hypothetical protein